MLARGSALCAVIAWALSLLWWLGTRRFLGTEAHSTFLYFVFFFPFARIPPSSTAACCSAAVPLHCAHPVLVTLEMCSLGSPPPTPAVLWQWVVLQQNVAGAAVPALGARATGAAPSAPEQLRCSITGSGPAHSNEGPQREPPAEPGLLMALSSVLPPCQDPHRPTPPCPSLGHISALCSLQP